MATGGWPPPPSKRQRRQKDAAASSEYQLSRRLFACTSSRDVTGAVAAFDAAVSSGAPLSIRQYNALLHLLTFRDSFSDSLVVARRVVDHLLAAGATPTEATIAFMASVAAASPGGGGDKAFDLVATMRERHGLAPRLRTYGPALAAFVAAGEADKAYEVEAHMESVGVASEESEIGMLFDVSARAGREAKVYEYLQKLRRVAAAGVTLGTVDLLEGWFKSEKAELAGEADCDAALVKDAIFMNGGGWHGVGWLGDGPWEARRVPVGFDGRCSGCAQQLACVDISRSEAERFAESIAKLAAERESKGNFSEFQHWLDEHQEFEAVIDAANVGFYQQNFLEGSFSVSQLDAVVIELYKRTGNKWPLIVLHQRRAAMLVENPSGRQLLESWEANGAMFMTPSGSNDDWYWLYAAVRLNCLLVTNDEMRDHIFELLGQPLFPRWKERHQVKYTFNKGNLELVMPPQYSPVIQESEKGAWHIPIADACDSENCNIWLCVTRRQSLRGLKGANGGCDHVGESVDPLEHLPVYSRVPPTDGNDDDDGSVSIGSGTGRPR